MVLQQDGYEWGGCEQGVLIGRITSETMKDRRVIGATLSAVTPFSITALWAFVHGKINAFRGPSGAFYFDGPSHNFNPSISLSLISC